MGKMYSFITYSRKAEKQVGELLKERGSVREKLLRLRENSRTELDAHKLKGELAGKWSCWLGGDLRLVYEIDDEKREIIIFSAGSHKESY